MKNEYIKLEKPTIITSKDLEDAKVLDLDDSPFSKAFDKLFEYFYWENGGIKMKNNKDIELKIADKLLELGVDISSKGFKYWVCLLSKVYENPCSKLQTMKLYEYVGNIFNDTPRTTERALRHSLENIKESIKSKYNISKLTATAFINLFIVKFFNEF